MLTAFRVLLIMFLLAIVIAIVVCKKIGIALIELGQRKAKSSGGKVTVTDPDTTPVSLVEVKVSLPTRVIFCCEAVSKRYDPSELAQLPKTRIGKGTLGSLYKVVVGCGSIVTVRKIREGLVDSDRLDFWVAFFGGLNDVWLLPLYFGFWYGGEAFTVHEYLCLGSLEELLHGSEGVQFTPLSWGTRQQIAVCAAKAVASIHSRVSKQGKALVCGVIKASNILIRPDFSACLSGYEIPYLIPPDTIIRRNPGRNAPELSHAHNTPKHFTTKSDVYSFGVLLLEIITGKKPTTTNLEDYVREEEKKEGLQGACDRRMVDVKDNLAGMLHVAALCLLHSPKERPSMERIAYMLQELQR